MIKHYLKIAIRNLLKYKLQNIISILCLAVGIVCFTVTFHFVVEIWKLYSYDLDSKCANVVFLDNAENHESSPLTETEFLRLKEQKPSSIGKLIFQKSDNEWVRAWTLTEPDGTEGALATLTCAVSPDYLNYYGFRSAITGKPIQHLKPGTILMSDWLWKKTVGEGVNPIGRQAVSTEEGERTLSGVISDVVCSNMRETLDGMLIVSDTPFLQSNSSGLYDLTVVLAEGKSKDDLDTDLNRLFPERFSFVIGVDTSKIMMLFGMLTLILLLGSSVLIIGTLGFLKMELQLFSLRTREMALRRCVGARPWQLFSLIAIEVIIVFFITSLIALGLTSVVADYAIPVVYAMTNFAFYLDMGIIYEREVWISICVTLLTLGIAALVVRRSIHAPLGMTVGRSTRTTHAGRSTMLVIQHVLYILLLAVILGTYFFVKHTAQAYHVPEDSSSIKQCMMIDRMHFGFTNDEVASLPSVDLDGCVLSANALSYEEIDTTLYVNYAALMNDDDTVMAYSYNVALANVQYFLALGIHPVAQHEGMDKHAMIPVYVSPQDAERVAKTLKAEGGQRQSKVLCDGKNYVCIGYVPVWADRIGSPSYYIIVPEVSYADARAMFPNNIEGRTTFYFILRPKPHCYNNLAEELNNLHHKKTPTDLRQLTIQNVYDTWFTQVRWADMLQQLCWLLTIISLLCIIFSVYSSVSLDSRSREKEVAIRKVHGAMTWDIVRLFARYYVSLLIISAIIAIPIGIAAGTTVMNMMHVNANALILSCQWIVTSLFVVTLITLLTISEKIYRVTKIDPVDIIKKE